MKKAVNWFLAFLLTGTLAFFGITWAFRQAVAPALKDGGTPVTEAVREKEMEQIRGKVQELGSIYGFDAERALKMITPEVLEDLNVQSAAWWNTLLTEGVSAEEPQWNTETIREQLSMDPSFVGNDSEEAADRKIMQAEAAIRQAVVRTVLPMRGNLMTLIMMQAGKRADLPNLIRFATGTPFFLLALSFLLAGLIAALQSRRLPGCLKYLGSAMGGGALVTICALIAGLTMPVAGMIGEASPSLLVQYSAVSSGMVLRLAVYAALLAAGCVLCLLAWRRSAFRTAGGE